MALAITIDPNRLVEIKVVGSKPEYRPYLRLAYTDANKKEISGGFIGSVDNANAMRGLANQILRALDGE